MSMISQIFGGPQITPPDSQSGSAAAATPDRRGGEYLSRFSAGQTVEGKVADIRGNEVQIELPNGGTVTARMDNAMALTPGQLMSFEVRSNSGSQIALSPLYTNLDMDPTAVKALTAAGMEVNARTLEMAGSMMERGMNIDSRSLGDMYHLISNMPGASAETLVEMRSLGLPVNEESVQQYSAFKNYENQIADGMREIADNALALYEELGGSESGEALSFAGQLTECFLEDEQPSALQEKSVLPEGEAAKEAAENMAGPQNGQGEGKLILTEDGSIAGGNAAVQLPGGGDAQTLEALFSRLADGSGSEALIKDKAEGAEQKAEAPLQGKTENARNDAVQSADPQLSRAAQNIRGNVLELLDRSQSPEAAQLSELIRNMPATDQNALRLCHTAIKLLEARGGQLPDKELETGLKELLRSEDFKTVVKNSMKESWTLKPEQVADKANVEQLYHRLSQQTRELTSSLQNISQPGSSFAQSLGNMSNNLDFMNQMNQAMQYVQLPLRMNGSETTGDLYVYSNKKNLANKDGSVSAMLHLDMEHMGTVDVYAAISSGNRVSTHFYLESDEMIDFISEHIHILNERLEKRGYSIRSEITNRDELNKKDGTRPLTPPTQSRLIAKQSFDVRA
ncbi:MAG: flagellar hook-length control protein FliK [Lachnospiraceae bacterium]|nr:flagellar hook-length control protein FliK [Lachnospiraceae bacterium]